LSIESVETSNADLDVERLMYEIRERVARQHRRVDESSSSSFGLSNGNYTAGRIGSLRLQPEFQPKHDNQYHINDLLKFHGADFLRNSYLALLLREPDEAGVARHLEGLGSGRFNKIDVLASLHSSPEGRRSPVRLAGLSIPSAVRRLGRVPFIGYLVRLMTAVVRLPLSLQHQNRFEFYLLSQLQRIVDHQNRTDQDSNDALAQISGQMLEGIQRATEQQQAIELSLRQYEEVLAQQTQLGKLINEAREYVDQRTTKLIEQIGSQTRQVLHKQETIIQQQQEFLSKQQQLGYRTDEQIQQLVVKQQRASNELRTQESRLMLLLEEVRLNAPAIPNSSFIQLAKDEEDHVLDALYASFEDQFRGERDEVRRRLKVYIPILRNARITNNVLDVGCGRGEWLQLLKTEGIQCQGVDRNRVFIEECRQAGLNVLEADALTHLRSLPPESLNCLTSFHLVEHLPFEVLVRFLYEIVRILRPGALLILETPNPENFMVGSCNFYTDPTHRNPIPWQTLQFLLESSGLDTIDVLKLRPWDEAKLEGDSEIIRRFNEYFYSAPDYGIIARKPDSTD
jgi:SAM-dependent methyltransferase